MTLSIPALVVIVMASATLGYLFSWFVLARLAGRPQDSRWAVQCVKTGHLAFHGRTYSSPEKALKAAQRRIPVWAWALSPYEIVEVPA